MTIQVTAFEWYFTIVLFVIFSKVVVIFDQHESVDKTSFIIKRECYSQHFFAVVLFIMIYYQLLSLQL